MVMRRWRRAMVFGAASLLAACAAPPADPVAAPGSHPELTPLAQRLAVPLGVTPRSAVAAVSYDIFSAPEPVDLPWDADDRAPPGSVEAGAPLKELERGGASWYGIQFHQKKTANGERFDMSALTAAHKTLPFGTQVCVRSLANNREVMVRINDRGPFAIDRVIDLSRAAADEIGMLGLGIKQVALSVVGRNQRCGAAVNPPDALEPIATVLSAPAVRRSKAPARQVPREVPARARR